MTYTIIIHKDDKLIASRSASPDMAVALLAEMLNNNPDLAAIVDNRVEDREVGRVRKTTYRALQPKPTKGKKEKKGTRVCKFCGKPGHMQKTCPVARGVEPLPQADMKAKPLDGFQYEALRDAMHDRDFSSAQYALTNKLSPREVNAAIRSKDYDDYLDSR